MKSETTVIKESPASFEYSSSGEISNKHRAEARAQQALKPTSFAKKETIFGKIVDVESNKVLVKCLVDEKNNDFVFRKFDKEPFVGAVNLEIGQLIEIEIHTKPGERKFVYRNSAKQNLEKIFEPVDYMEGLENSPFFKPLASKNENNF